MYLCQTHEMSRKTIFFDNFEWDIEKARDNLKKHGVAFLDPLRIIAVDEAHSKNEERYFCIGKVDSKILTFRFTYRSKKIRIIGAGYWRKGRKFYEKENA